MYRIEEFSKLAEPEFLVMTLHSRKRLQERSITIDDICRVLQEGEIIEQYPDDSPFPSCLILGYSGNKIIHVCASIDEGNVYIITAYIPNGEKWKDDYRTRKETKR